MNILTKPTLCFIVIFTFMLSAQVFAQDFHLGIETGYDFETRINTANNDEYSKIPAFKSGFVMEFSPYFSKLFITSGATFSSGKSEKTNESSQTIFIPLMFRVVLGDLIQPYFEGGAYYGYLLSETTMGEEKNDIGAKAGAGLQLELGKRWRVDLGFKYSYGFTPVLEIEEALPLNQIHMESYHRIIKGLAFQVKYRF